MTSKKTCKRILKVVIKRMVDSDPDTSWLGEYSDKRTSEYSIDREHSEECPINTGLSSELLSEEDQADCDCGRHGDRLRDEVQFFNPSFNYVDSNGHALKENTPEEIRKYVRQDYERMESLNHGNWCFIGVEAEARVQLLGDVVQTIQSGGLWGIESDSGDYLKEEGVNQLAELRDQLHALGFSQRAISAAFRKVEHKNE